MSESYNALIVSLDPEDLSALPGKVKESLPSLSVTLAGEGADFYRALQDRAFDLVLTAPTLGEEARNGVLRAVKSRFPECPVVMFGAPEESFSRSQAIFRSMAEPVIRPAADFRNLPETLKPLLRRIERRRNQAALLRYESLFNSLPIGIYLTTITGNIVEVNPALVEMLGYSDREELLSANVESGYVDPEDRRHWQAQMERDGVVVNFRSRWIRRDGTPIWVRETARLVLGPDGKPQYYEGTVEDISRETDLLEQLVHSQKMEALGRMAGGIAHDFNNILTAIIGYSDLTVARIHDKQKVRRNLDLILNAGKRASVLTRQLLAFSRKQPLTPRVFDLHRIVLDVRKMASTLVSEEVDLSVALGPGAAWVRSDPGHLEQVLVNLLLNSRDALPRGGHIRILTRLEPNREGLVPAGESGPAGEAVALEVEDDGVGMDRDTLSRIFEPFFTTKKKGRGTGIGLSIVYATVQQSGGLVFVDSEPNKGTRFRILLPGVPAPPPEEQADIETAAESTERMTILLAEDDEVVRLLVKETLALEGHDVFSFSDGQAALAGAEKMDQIDLLVTDMVMPLLGGAELARELRNRFPVLKILFVSGYSDEAKGGRPFMDGNSAFLPKPFDLDTLLTEVKALLERPSRL